MRIWSTTMTEKTASLRSVGSKNGRTWWISCRKWGRRKSLGWPTFQAWMPGWMVVSSTVSNNKAKNSGFKWEGVVSLGRLSLRCFCNFQMDTFTSWVRTGLEYWKEIGNKKCRFGSINTDGILKLERRWVFPKGYKWREKLNAKFGNLSSPILDSSERVPGFQQIFKRGL